VPREQPPEDGHRQVGDRFVEPGAEAAERVVGVDEQFGAGHGREPGRVR
jgi:hypothetical protein